jgi:hypothetical protein
MLRLLVEEENHLGHTREHLAKLDRHISRLSEIMAQHLDLMDNLNPLANLQNGHRWCWRPIMI